LRPSGIANRKGFMTLYEFLLFIHIAATIVWVGSGVFGIVLALGYDKDGDAAATERLLKDNERLALRLFVPSSLVVVLAGIALVIESEAWTFDQLWLVIGLVGFATTFCTGLFVLKPVGDRVAAQMKRDGGLTPQTLVAVQRLLVKARTDYLVLALVVFDMVIKPTGDDVGVLIGMAAVGVLGLAYIVVSLRAIDSRAEPAPATA
jgi:uncharacterized membrane protein